MTETTTFFEITLAGDQGSPQAFRQALSQQLRRLPRRAVLQRVEVRYSTRAPASFDRDGVRRALDGLAQQVGGAHRIPVSVRSHLDPEGGAPSLLDDAAGQHVLRGIGVRQPTWWQRLAARWTSRHRAGRDAGAGPDATRREPALKEDDVPLSLAVQRLREAVAHAAEQYRPPRSGWRRHAPTAPAPVARAEVVVRHAELDRVLRHLVPADAPGMAALLARARLVVTPGFSVAYTVQAVPEGDGTSLAGLRDLEVRLFGQEPAADTVCDTLDMQGPGSALPVVRQDGAWRPDAPGDAATALPPAQADPRGVRVRLLGTLDKPFADPFVLHLPSLPARVDRDTLALAGFGRRHGPLLAVASNRCPLIIERGDDSRIRVRFTCREHEGQRLPMFRHGDTLEVLDGERPLDQLPGSIVLNDPSGVIDPQSGRTLPALRLQVLPG